MVRFGKWGNSVIDTLGFAISPKELELLCIIWICLRSYGVVIMCFMFRYVKVMSQTPPVELSKDLSYEDKPVTILDQREKVL